MLLICEGHKVQGSLKVVEAGGPGQMKVLGFHEKPHLEPLSRHLRSAINVPGARGASSVEIDLLLDSGLRVVAISEGDVNNIPRGHPRVTLAYPLEVRRGRP